MTRRQLSTLRKFSVFAKVLILYNSVVDRGEMAKITQNGFHESKKSVDAEQVALVIFNSIALITPTTHKIWHMRKSGDNFKVDLSVPKINTNTKYASIHTMFGWLWSFFPNRISRLTVSPHFIQLTYRFLAGQTNCRNK